MLKAKSIMAQNVISVKEDTPIFEAVEIILENKITGLPVVSDDMRLVGIISEKDVLKLLYDPNTEEGIVADFMTREVTYFDEDDELVLICEKLISSNFRRVPILSEGKLTGIISRHDIIKFIMKIRKNKA